ncbi:isochorismatase family cysteine hydrolase [Pseudodonghicola xiamenensis]|uniref:Hydrolase n=1 Tax=Pseudodonghicola xiamenensis TaxID=337702 RepID=A0A8J3MFC6_9RHOB|nr:isochorismatase family cysteine hydrolase [Pseudodonghicola xiamenensis]GHH03890.1 hydrolase [Pseudodonghicola xiamenensis]
METEKVSTPHPFDMPQWAIDRVVARQGQPLVHREVPAAETALVVVDMQNYFMEAESPASVPRARAIVDNINRLAAALRAAGGKVVWIRTLFTEEALAEIEHFHRVLLLPDRFEARCEALARDAEGSQLWPGLDVRAEDLIIEKTRYSGMIQGAGDLEAQLKAAGVSAMLVAGTMTNACCESTARDAMMRNFRTTMVHDANATLRDDEHAAALINFYLFFGDVAGTEELVARYPAG